MKQLKEYNIPFVGLKQGEHHFDFTIDQKFFADFLYNEFDTVAHQVDLKLIKKTTLLELFFTTKGTVNVPCDVTGESFDLESDGEMNLVVKFDKEFNNDDDELLVLPHDAFQIDVSQYIYELIVLSVPQKRVKPGIESQLEEYEEPEQEQEETEQEIDPRWAKLKGLIKD